MKIIGLIGYKLSGKDTAADYLCQNYNYTKLAFATPLKQITSILFDWSKEQLHDQNLKEKIDPRWNISPRDSFKFVGTDLVRMHMNELIPGIGEDFWTVYTERKIIDLIKNDQKVIIADVRHQNEAAMIKKLGGVLIKIYRHDLLDTHTSETDVDLIINIDHEIDNKDTIELFYKSLDEIIKTN